MNKAQFATLVGVSAAMVSKYAANGLVLDAEGGVDALASLSNLEGRLDEAKRRRALAVLGKTAPGPANASAARTSAPMVTMSAKAQKDEIERDLKRLEYGQKVGELVLAADVEDKARQAVAAMREAFANGRRDLADQICAQFGVPADRSSALARFLGVAFERALGTFSQQMAELAATGAASLSTADEAPDVAEAV